MEVRLDWRVVDFFQYCTKKSLKTAFVAQPFNTDRAVRPLGAQSGQKLSGLAELKASTEEKRLAFRNMLEFHMAIRNAYAASCQVFSLSKKT